MTDNINEELSAALTKLTETESQVKTAKENMSLANENLDLATFSYNEGKASMVDVTFRPVVMDASTHQSDQCLSGREDGCG